MPTAGPSASRIQAVRQPTPSVGASRPTPRIVIPVRMKPVASWSDSADPAVPGGESSETAAENWAESAITVIPQTRPTAVTSAGVAPNRNPIKIAVPPLPAIAAIVSVVRPRVSASAPATTQPMPPLATTTKAAAADVPGSTVPAATNDAARNAGTHVHIAYNSHMWPR